MMDHLRMMWRKVAKPMARYGPVMTRDHAKAMGWLGPFWHGTERQTANQIRQQGFREQQLEDWEYDDPGTQEEIDKGMLFLTFMATTREGVEGYGDGGVVECYVRPGSIQDGWGPGLVVVGKVDDVAAISDPLPPRTASLEKLDYDSIRVSDEERARNQNAVKPTHVEECFACGRGMTEAGADRAWFIHLGDSGDSILHNDDRSQDGTSSDLGYYPVGPECAKKVPATHKSRS